MNEITINIDGQWFYRGNRSPSWFALNSLGGCGCSAFGISEKVPPKEWPWLEAMASELHGAVL